jgi:hypothetical protein
VAAASRRAGEPLYRTGLTRLRTGSLGVATPKLKIENVLEHLAGVEDFDLAMATYRAACLRWPGAAVTIGQGARIFEDSRKRA